MEQFSKAAPKGESKNIIFSTKGTNSNYPTISKLS